LRTIERIGDTINCTRCLDVMFDSGDTTFASKIKTLFICPTCKKQEWVIDNTGKINLTNFSLGGKE
jgi:Zn finger protein HypA/HybF involved in hydrogenase expression